MIALGVYYQYLWFIMYVQVCFAILFEIICVIYLWIATSQIVHCLTRKLSSVSLGNQHSLQKFPEACSQQEVSDTCDYGSVCCPCVDSKRLHEGARNMFSGKKFGALYFLWPIAFQDAPSYLPFLGCAGAPEGLHKQPLGNYMSCQKSTHKTFKHQRFFI